MKYIIQIFRLSGPDSNVGSWRNTAWASDDLDRTVSIAKQIAQFNRQNIAKVRVVQMVMELDCEKNP